MAGSNNSTVRSKRRPTGGPISGGGWSPRRANRCPGHRFNSTRMTLTTRLSSSTRRDQRGAWRPHRTRRAAGRRAWHSPAPSGYLGPRRLHSSTPQPTSPAKLAAGQPIARPSGWQGLADVVGPNLSDACPHICASEQPPSAIEQLSVVDRRPRRCGRGRRLHPAYENITGHYRHSVTLSAR